METDDKLRRMLDDRGVKWDGVINEDTSWKIHHGREDMASGGGG
jgi:hypothetical protein